MNIVFRVDANAQIGSGHFFRCLALAEALKKSGAVVMFVCSELPEYLCGILLSGGYDLIANFHERNIRSIDHSDSVNEYGDLDQELDAFALLEAISDKSIDWIVVDHYALDAKWQKIIKLAAKRLLVIDDLANRRHVCDLLIDQNYYLDKDMRYKELVPKHCRLLLGPKYALLRRGFSDARKSIKQRDGVVRNILIMFGGGAVDDYIVMAVDALNSLHLTNIRVDVVVGAQQSNFSFIEKKCAEFGFNCHVQPDRLIQIMSEADLAIGGGGATTWERCCLGLPSFSIAIAENQVKLLEDAAVNGFVYAPRVDNLDSKFFAQHVDMLIKNPELLRMLSMNSLASTDGRGVNRVLRFMGCSLVYVREATIDDCERVFEWRNNRAVRLASKSPNCIDWVEHQLWFANVIYDENILLLIGEIDGQELGVVRFDVKNTEARISIYLTPEGKGRYIGVDLLCAAEEWFVRNFPNVKLFTAEVLANNVSSHMLFQSFGYNRQTTTYIKNIRKN